MHSQLDVNQCESEDHAETCVGKGMVLLGAVLTALVMGLLVIGLLFE